MTDNLQRDHTDPVDELLLSARTERAALGRPFDAFCPLIFAYCLRRLVLRAVAEEVTSEVFLKVAVGIRHFSGTRALLNLRQSICRRELLEAAVQMGTIDRAVSISATRP